MASYPIRTELALRIAAVVEVEAVTHEEAVAAVKSGRPDIAARMRPELGKLLTVDTIGAGLRGEHAEKPVGGMSCALHGPHDGDACGACAAAPSEVVSSVGLRNLLASFLPHYTRQERLAIADRIVGSDRAMRLLLAEAADTLQGATGLGYRPLLERMRGAANG